MRLRARLQAQPRVHRLGNKGAVLMDSGIGPLHGSEALMPIIPSMDRIASLRRRRDTRVNHGQRPSHDRA